MTGSRIPTNVLSPGVPVTVLDRADIERGDSDSIAQVLQALPFNTGSPQNANVNNSGDGSARLDLRGLGPQRTLILLNGRRLPNGGVGADSSVDLNSIPVSMIDRVEVLTSGATAIYGADAVAGTVNIITRDRFHGLEVGAHQSVASLGDGPVTRAEAVDGSDLPGDGNVVFGLDYVNQSAINADRRAYSSAPLHILDNSGKPQYLGSGITPYGPIVVPDGNTLGLAAGRYRLIPGTDGRAAADYQRANSANTFNYEPYTYLQTPNERSSAWGQASLPMGGTTSAFVEGLWNLRKSSQRLAPTPYASDGDGAPQLADGSSGIPASNYYNPFGVDLPVVRRRFVEINDRGYSEDVHLWRSVAGMRGKVGAWHWEGSLSYSSSSAQTRENGLISLAHLLPAIGPSGVDHAGNIVCGAPDASGMVPSANVIAGCVPVNLFGGPGTVTTAQVNYLQVPLKDRGFNAQRLANATFEGPWGSLFGRPIAWAVGGAYRREEGRYVFDKLRSEGIAGNPLEADVPGGSFSERDAYAEIRATLLHDIPAVQELTLNAGARYSDFSNFGGHPAWQAGLRWLPVRALSLRASFATGFRAPSIAEVYQVQVPGLDNATLDPCGNNPTPRERANCAAHGVPGGSYLQNPNVGFTTIAGGNRGLGPERAQSFTAGLDLNWEGAAAGRASLGFFRTAMTGYIGQAAASTLLTECADEGVVAACNHIERNPDGSLNSVIATEQNFGRVMVRGLDMGLNADAPTRWGRFQAGVITTYLARRDKQPFLDSAVVPDAGSLDVDESRAYPHWRVLGHVDWQYRGWRLSYAVQLIGSFAENVLLDSGTYRHSIHAVTYHDFAGGYAFASGLLVRAGISNLTDKYPPFIDNNSGANTDTATYRLLGRTYFAELRYQFQ